MLMIASYFARQINKAASNQHINLDKLDIFKLSFKHEFEFGHGLFTCLGSMYTHFFSSFAIRFQPHVRFVYLYFQCVLSLHIWFHYTGSWSSLLFLPYILLLLVVIMDDSHTKKKSILFLLMKDVYKNEMLEKIGGSFDSD